MSFYLSINPKRNMNYYILFVSFVSILRFTIAYDTDMRIFPGFKCLTVGNFSHPDKCTSLVHCNSELTAYEIQCPPCTDPERCPEGRLYYDAEQDTCDTANLAKCPARDECDMTCMQEGYCDCFNTCLSDNSSSTGGRWSESIRCDVGLFWNPDYLGNQHGGSCDFWENLTPEIQETYRMDHNCVTPALECYWEADPECDNKYYYLPHDSKNISNLQHLNCPVSSEGTQLFWNQETKSCGFKCQKEPNCTICE